MTYIDELLSQLNNGSFRNMLFTIFNYIEEDGYLREIETKYGSMDVDDFEYFLFSINEDEKKALKMKRKSGYKELLDFKYHVEKELQSGVPDVAIFLMNDKGAMVAVKPKTVRLSEVFK